MSLNTLARAVGLPGDCMIARWNKPRDSGDVRWTMTEPPPDDWPKIVTAFGLPPKAEMLR